MKISEDASSRSKQQDKLETAVHSVSMKKCTFRKMVHVGLEVCQQIVAQRIVLPPPTHLLLIL